MNKIVALFVILCGISVGYSIPIQNALMYYRHASPYMVPQHSMYGFHYQNQQLRNQRRSAGVSAFAAGNTIATGTFLKGKYIESAEQPVQNDQNVQSTAEAYPEEQFPVEDEPQFDVPAVHDQDAVEPIADEPVADPAAEPAADPAAPALPAIIPDKKKKVTVKLDSDEDETAVYVGRRGEKAAEPSSYFPINFGGTSGGAIAIANSYSTGKGGSATSTATAYGSPAAAELRRATQPAQLKKKPAKLRARKY
ncbi:uncharacterized protein LOC131689914 isoform X2 [Topomyia yanbarensis]|uniref:uncharacterized protein LOC131689914 isoform X2 n=1 Tax=Topomyia yanbarensis TaxID=2498891 RepID=UPI00273B55D1|nr:uncharacterized protein LOC131689914 isoform X2 [Topomyia yanbarensis]